MKLLNATFFVLGFSDETEEDIRLMIKYRKRIPNNKVLFGNFCPYPRIEIYNNLKREAGKDK
ncbi:MAG: hypothetical protein Q8R31_06750 [Candidatus Omnitrophota bacterium]|nr:hypothetical protein [Candidatus Omnitrophota bacterium]